MLCAVFMISMMCCCVYWPCCCWLCGQCGRCLVPRPGARCLCGRGGGGRSDTVQAAELEIIMLARHRVNVSITSPTPTHHPRSHDGRSIRNDGCCQPDMQARFNNHWCNNQRRHLLTCLHLLFFVEYTYLLVLSSYTGIFIVSSHLHLIYIGMHVSENCHHWAVREKFSVWVHMSTSVPIFMQRQVVMLEH